MRYVVAQAGGAVFAALIAWACVKETHAPAVLPGHLFGAILLETFFTFALALVVLNSATAAKTEGNSFYGLAIGFTVAAAAFASAPISGGAFNPAVGFGPILIDTINGGKSIADLWVYLIFPTIGGAGAAVVFLYQHEMPLPAVRTAAPPARRTCSRRRFEGAGRGLRVRAILGYLALFGSRSRERRTRTVRPRAG